MSASTTEPVSHPILGFARALDAALDKVGTVDPIFMTPTDKRTALARLAREQARLEALSLRVLAAADQDDIGTVNGSSSTGAWLAHATHADQPAARATVRLATTLDRKHQTTTAALAAGEFSVEHARIIVWALHRLPDGLEPEVLQAAEDVMISEARRLCPAQLRIAGKHLLDVIAPDVADEILGKQLDEDERRAYSRARFSTRSNGDGTTQGWFRVPDMHAAMLKAALDAITAPRKTGADRIHPDTGRHLDHAALLGQGFCDLIEHLPTDELPEHGRTAATIVVTLSRETLATALAAAGFTGGDSLSAGEVRRLACNAGIIPAVLGGKSAPLDLGREARLYSKAQHLAMAIRDGGCRAETCDRPPSWCEAHHAGQPWSHGGRTDIAEGVLLCGFHHRLAHHAHYDTSRLPNGDVRFTRRT